VGLVSLCPKLRASPQGHQAFFLEPDVKIDDADVREPLSEVSIQTRVTGLRLLLWGLIETVTPAEEIGGYQIEEDDEPWDSYPSQPVQSGSGSARHCAKLIADNQAEGAATIMMRKRHWGGP
jgi:hypothetical protein